MVTTKLVNGQRAETWDGWSLSQVEVHHGDPSPIPGLDALWKRMEKVDTVPYIRSLGSPAVVDDSLVIGIGGSSASVWTYNVRTKELKRTPLPAWLMTSWPTPPPGFSPDGRFIAYLSQDYDTTRLTVRSWPDGRVVAQSPPVHLRQIRPPRGGALLWANPTRLHASFPVSDSGPSIAWLEGVVRGKGVDVVTWKIYPDYADPNMRRPVPPPAEQVASVDTVTTRAHPVAEEIERLAPSAFPELPTAFATQLEQLGCTIPQSGYTGRSGNVIQGSFGAPGQRDWAVLCSRNGSSVIRVYWGGRTKCPSEFGPAADKDFLQGVGDGRIGFSRGITTTDAYHEYPDESDTASVDRAVKLEHDAIDDAFEGKASRVVFCRNGKWIVFSGAD